MNNDMMDNDKFSFGVKSNNQVQNEFAYDEINGIGQSDYENEDLFNVDNLDDNKYDAFRTLTTDNQAKDEESSNDLVDESHVEENNYYNQNFTEDFNLELTLDEQNKIDNNKTNEIIEEFPNVDVDNIESLEEVNQNSANDNDSISVINNEYLDVNDTFTNSYLDDNYNLPVVEPTVEVVDETKKKSKTLSDTPIIELEKLTHFEEEKIQTTDIKSLFDKVGTNVKEASDIFKKNTEMKEKIDSRFEELKKLQSEVERSKQSQYDEINSYKEEVLGKLTEKKEEIEKRLNKLKEFQNSLEKERQEFEQYKKAEKEEIDRVQKEVQEAYESRREELSHIEDVLRKQKDALDEERSQLSLDRIQYESDKNELANNLLKFNEIVDSFTNGMDKINKE